MKAIEANNYSRLSVIVPVYNEAGTIIELVDRVRDSVPGAEVVVVNDGSTDETMSVLKTLKCEGIKIISVGQNRGKGFAVRRGIEAARGSIMVQIDSDLQFLPEEIPKLISPIFGNEADIVFGSRYICDSGATGANVSLLKRFGSYAVSGIVSLICGRNYTDIFAGFKAWRKDAMERISLAEDGFAYEAEIAIRARDKDIRIVELPIGYDRRKYGYSKLSILKEMFILPLKLLFLWFRT
ncbi:MAG: glycosyltransferase family 2 protein [Candidatus Omnitrophica bacterium]|nr:glycosyltransferase family 2 protein [Candidatus Omnitrophota bacterium]